MLSMQCRKNITVEDNKKGINIYTNIYIPILYVARMTQNKNNSINQYCHKVVLLTVVVGCYFLFQNFRIWSVLQIVKMEVSYHVLSYKDQKQLKCFWVWKSPAVKASPNYKKQHWALLSMRKIKSNNFVILTRNISR